MFKLQRCIDLISWSQSNTFKALKRIKKYEQFFKEYPMTILELEL